MDTQPQQIEVPLERRDALSIPETGKVVGVGISKLYQEIRTGRLISSKVGDRRIVTRENRLAWLRSCEVRR